MLCIIKSNFAILIVIQNTTTYKNESQQVVIVAANDLLRAHTLHKY